MYKNKNFIKLKEFMSSLSEILDEIKKIEEEIKKIKRQENSLKDEKLKKSFLNLKNSKSYPEDLKYIEKELKEHYISLYNLNELLEKKLSDEKEIRKKINQLMPLLRKEIINRIKEIIDFIFKEKTFSRLVNTGIIDSLFMSIEKLEINDVTEYSLDSVILIDTLLSKLNQSFTKFMNTNDISIINSIEINIKRLRQELENISTIHSTYDSTHTINQINTITKKLKELENKNDDKTKELLSEKLERERLEKELKIKNLEYNKQLEKESKLKEELAKKVQEEKLVIEEKEKITKAIKKLKNPSPELKALKNDYEKEKNNFNLNAERMFMLAGALFGAILVYIFCYEGMIEFKNANFSFYLAHIFPIIFPTLIGFLFVRQANIKSNQIENINKRFILIHEVNQSLEALVEVNKGQNMDNKTEKIIDKLINNILDFTISKKENTISDNEIIDINKKIDSLITTIKTKYDISDLTS